MASVEFPNTETSISTSSLNCNSSSDFDLDEEEKKIYSFCEFINQTQLAIKEEKEKSIPLASAAKLMSDVTYRFTAIAEYAKLPTLNLFSCQSKFSLIPRESKKSFGNSSTDHSSSSKKKEGELSSFLPSGCPPLIPSSLCSAFAAFAYLFGLNCCQRHFYSFGVTLFALAVGFWSLPNDPEEGKEERLGWMIKSALAAVAALDEQAGISYGADRISHAQQIIDSEKRLRSIIRRRSLPLPISTVTLGADGSTTNPSPSSPLPSHFLSLDRFHFLLKGNILQANIFQFLGNQEKLHQHQQIAAPSNQGVPLLAPNIDSFSFPPELKVAIDHFFTSPPFPDLNQCETIANLSIHFSLPALAYTLISRGLSIQLAQPLSPPDLLAHFYRKLLTTTISHGQATEIYSEILRSHSYPQFSLTESQWLVCDCWNRGVVAVRMGGKNGLQEGKGLLALAMELWEKSSNHDNEGGGMNEAKLKQKESIREELRRQWDSIDNPRKARNKPLLTKHTLDKKPKK